MQEVDLQRYRTRLVSLGKLQDAAGANLRPRREQSFQESIRAFEGELCCRRATRQLKTTSPTKGCVTDLYSSSTVRQQHT